MEDHLVRIRVRQIDRDEVAIITSLEKSSNLDRLSFEQPGILLDLRMIAERNDLGGDGNVDLGSLQQGSKNRAHLLEPQPDLAALFFTGVGH